MTNEERLEALKNIRWSFRLIEETTTRLPLSSCRDLQKVILDAIKVAETNELAPLIKDAQRAVFGPEPEETEP